MNHLVPECDTDDDYAKVVNSNSCSSLNPARKPITNRGQDGDDDLMELLWQNGQVVTQNQRLNNTKKPSSSRVHEEEQPSDQSNLFIQEDEMASWLHYPLRQDDLCSDLLFSAARPPAPPVRPPVRNFTNFSRLRGDFTKSGGGGANTPDDSEKGKAVASEIPGTSSSKSEMEPETERKRKESGEDSKQGRGSTKRSRAAQVHNLSERKRRDRINERMKALQELIPRCNKSDKASMLDEAIEYMKSLQLQIQMMSMGCGMMYPGMPMGMGIPPPSFMPFPNMLPPPQRPLPTLASLFSGPHYPSTLHVPSHHSTDPTPSQPQYQQSRSLHPPQFQSQAASYPSSSRVGSSRSGNRLMPVFTSTHNFEKLTERET